MLRAMLGRQALRLWARTGVAPAYLNRAIDGIGATFGSPGLKTDVLGKFEFNVDLADHVQRRMFYLGAYEVIDSFLIGLLIKPGMVFVDAGANIGQYSLLAADRVGQTGHVHAFEPVAANYSKFRRNIDRNQLSARITANQLALWHQPDTLHFSLPLGKEDNQGSFTAATGANSPSEVTCQAVTLDQYCVDQGVHRIDIMKMDIEGSELNALRGGSDILRRSPPIILLEINREASEPFGYSQSDLHDFFEPMGYEYWRIADSVEHSGPVTSLCDIDRANVICHVGALPAEVTCGWSLKRLLRSRGIKG